MLARRASKAVKPHARCRRSSYWSSQKYCQYVGPFRGPAEVAQPLLVGEDRVQLRPHHAVQVRGFPGAKSHTRNLVSVGTLALMKPTAYLVNTWRGEVVNESDLFAALSAKKIAAAGLDVFEHEPLVGSPLQTLDNVILTAHTAGVDVRSREDMAHFAALAIAKLFNGEWPTEWVVNPELKAKWQPS